MNIKKHLKSVSIISILCTGILLAPSSALAEKNYSKSQQHGNSYSKQRSSSKYRTTKSRSHAPKHSNRYNNHNRYNSHGKKYYAPNQHRVKRHQDNGRQHRHNYSVGYYASPWYVQQNYWDNGHFSIGYQDDNFSFVFRE